MTTPALIVPLIKAVSALFGVDSIFVCGGGSNFTDNNLSTWSRLVNELELGLQADFWEGAPRHGIEDDTLLVYLTEEACFTDLVETVGMKSNVIWLSPDSLDFITADHLRLDSNWITFSEESVNGTLQLFEHYAVAHTKKFVNKLGTWSLTFGINILQSELWERRNDLDGINFVNTVNDYPPVLIFIEEPHVIDGFLPEVLRTIQSHMNFTVTNQRPQDEQWGVEMEYENGTKYWTGLVGDLVAGRADLSISGLTIHADRGRAIDYTVGVLPESVTINIGSHSLSTSNINTMAFIRVLSTETWFVFLSLAIVFGMCHCIIELIKNFTYTGSCHRSITVYGCIMIGMIFLKLPVKLGNWLSQKILFLMACVACLFVFEGYVGQLTAEMTVGTPKAHLKSFQDIIDNEIRLLVTEGTMSDQYFLSAPEGSLRHFINEHNVDRQKQRGMSHPEHVARLGKDSKLAFFESAIDFLPYKDVTSLLDFDGRIQAVIGIGLQKNSELKAAFDYHIIHMRETGLLNEMYNHWLQSDKPDDQSDRIFEHDILILGFDNLFLPANIMALGIISAVVISAMEKLSYRQTSANDVEKNLSKTLFE